MTATFHLGPLTIRWYGSMLAEAAIMAISLAKEVKRRGQTSKHIMNIALFVLSLGIIGARLYHVINTALSQDD